MFIFVAVFNSEQIAEKRFGALQETRDKSIFKLNN